MSTNHTLSSANTSGITLTASGADGTPFTITDTGSINNVSAGGSYGALTGTVLSTVTNAGHVTSNRYGIYLRRYRLDAEPDDRAEDAAGNAHRGGRHSVVLYFPAELREQRTKLPQNHLVHLRRQMRAPVTGDTFPQKRTVVFDTSRPARH